VRVLLMGAPNPGWASVFVAVLMVGCMQLLGIGLVGEYLGRTYLRMNGKPQFVVRERTPSEVLSTATKNLVGGIGAVNEKTNGDHS
jgi:hypothetical protein